MGSPYAGTTLELGISNAQKHEFGIVIGTPLQFLKTLWRLEASGLGLLHHEQGARRQPTSVTQGSERRIRKPLGIGRIEEHQRERLHRMRRTEVGGVTKVYRRDATDLGPVHPVEPFSLVFLDPPYGKGLADKALGSLRDGGWLTREALLVVEETKSAGFKAPEGFSELERRAYDDTEFTFLKFKI